MSPGTGAGRLHQTNQPLRLADALDRWRAAVEQSSPATTVAELGVTGYSLLSEPTVPAHEPHFPLIARRPDLDPMELRLANRLIARATSVEPGGSYGDRAELLEDLRLLGRIVRVPESRRSVYEAMADLIVAGRRGEGGTLAVLGESGIGKTYLWHRCADEHGQDDDVFVYHKSPQTGSEPYAVYANVLGELVRTIAARDGETAEGFLSRVMAEPGPHEGARGILPTILPEILNRALPVPEETSASDRLIDYPRVLSWVLVQVARCPGACVIAVDDLQWADAQSLDVLHRLVAEPARLSIVFMGRPEARGDLPARVRRLETVEPLTDAESRDLLRALLLPGRDHQRESALWRWIADRARGNPLAIMETVRNAFQTESLARSLSPEDGVVRLIDERLQALSPPARTLLEYLSLLLPPVPVRLVDRIPGLRADEIEDLLGEAIRAGLLSRSAGNGGVHFYHDSVETAVRARALASSDRVAATARLLHAEAHAGDRRASYALARVLSDDPMPGSRDRDLEAPDEVRRLLPTADAVSTLHDAARWARAVAVPHDTLRFAERALAMGAATIGQHDAAELHTLAHEAAFLLDDPYAMSRHFQYIRAHTDWLEVNRARTLWISRAYAKLWIRGAVRIGWNILFTLGAVRAVAFDDQHARRRQLDAADAFLTTNRPGRLYRRIARMDPDRDRRSELVVTTAAMLFIPLLTIDPQRMGVAAHLILREALEHGRSDHVGMAFVFWSVWASQRRLPVKRRYQLARLARRVKGAPWAGDHGGADKAHHTVATYATIMGMHWGVDHRAVADELFRLYERGLSLANHEWAAHAAHIHAQSLFLRADPLSHVSHVMNDYAVRFERLGVTRVAVALAKWQQAAECLMGEVGDPLVLTGSYCEDRTLLDGLELHEDLLARAGYYILKGVLAVYGGVLDPGLSCWREFEKHEPIVGCIYPVTVFWFFYGLSSWAAGDRVRGRRALERVRETGFAASGPHRLTALLAERDRARGRARRSARRYARARRQALEDGFMSEAALISERQGIHLAAMGDTAGAREALHVARSLYLEWGAAPAAERVARRLQGISGRSRAASLVPKGRHDAGDSSVAGRALEQTREYTRLLFEAVQDALLLIDGTGRVLFRSPAAEQYLQVHADESVEFHAGLSEPVRSLAAAALEGRAPREAELDWQGKLLRIAVSPAPEHVQSESTTASTSDDGGPRGTVLALVLRDVSRVRERERALIVADRMSSLGMLASTVAHEVGNPNHVIELNAQALGLILRRFRASPQQFAWDAAERALESISEGTTRIEHVIRQVTEYAREGHEEQWDWVNPDDIARRVIRFTRLLVREYTSEVVYEPEVDLPLIRVVRGRLEQALINLIKNACEALPNRDARIALRVRRAVGAAEAEHHGTRSVGQSVGITQYVCFSVCDQGPGIQTTGIINPDGSVGSPFHTTRGGDGGTGLGLSIVRAIVERHGGLFRFTHDDEYASIAQVFVPVGESEAKGGPS